MAFRRWLMVLTLGGIFACASTPTAPKNVGLVDGKLRPCPSSPNCVCSQGKEDKEHSIDPLPYTGDLAEARKRLRSVIEAMPRTRFAEERPDYWRVEFTTLIMRFVDDVEFLFDPSLKVIHVRSASRVGHSDLGANRKRVNAIREAFLEAQKN